MSRLLLLGMLAASATCGCSSGGGSAGAGSSGGSGGTHPSGDALSCEWLAGADNCWQAAVDQAYAECAVPKGTEGFYGDDYLSCNYPNGDSDVYGAVGRTIDGGGNGHDNFYVEAIRGGSMCFVFEAPAEQLDGVTLSLTTRSGRVAFTSSSSSSSSISIECPNGRTLSASGAQMLAIFSCPLRQYADGSAMLPLPGYVNSESSFTLLPPPLPAASGTLTSCTCAPSQPSSDGGLPPPEPGCPYI